MLASSTKLSSNAYSTLLLLSDLVPGIRINDVNGYWTGVPLREAKQYALMRTWFAPEMPRPGCVWTHAVLVSFSDIARFVDLGVLRSLCAPPDAPGKYEKYGNTVTINPSYLSELVNANNLRSEGLANAIRLIRAVYGDLPKSDIEVKPGEFDDALFALWSQQWPRLRRSFTFRTAASKLEGAYPNVKFDIRLVVCSDSKLASTSETISDPMPWEITAVDDMSSKLPTEFRRFLWRYGSDINRGRERYSFLADLYLKTRTDLLKSESLDVVLEVVAQRIPDLVDGFTLKEDLVACGESKFSLFPAVDPIDTLAFFVRHPEIRGLPFPKIDIPAALQKSWHSRVNEILNLAEIATECISETGDAILSCLANIVEPPVLFRLLRERPNLQKHLIPMNPNILISKEIVNIQQPELSRLLDLIPNNRLDIVDKLIVYLLPLDNADIAKEISYRFPRETLLATTEFLRRSIEEVGEDLPLAWRREIKRNRSSLLNSGIIENARSTRFLSELSNILEYDSFEVLKVGPTPWITALRVANDDVCGHERQTFLGFLLALAIKHPVTGSELIFERAFEVVHNDIWNSHFSWDGLSILRRHLPDIGWLGNWDNCKRLRTAVVSSYLNGNLDPMSFYRLTNDPNLWDRLKDSASETKKGQRFLKRISTYK